MAYSAGLIFNDVRIELGQRLDEVFVVLSVGRRLRLKLYQRLAAA
jgi:hypothetical protein